MSEIHQTIQGSQIHNPGQTASQVGAGQPVAATGSAVNKNATVHGQVTGTNIVIHNPG